MFFDYLTILNYKTQGEDTNSIITKSKKIVGAIKSGDTQAYDQIFNKIKSDKESYNKVINYFKDFTLVPIPGSSITDEKNLWVSKLICEKMISHGFGRDIEPTLIRKIAIRKSHKSINNRPNIQEHIETIGFSGDSLIFNKVILVDDFLTIGSTATACYLKLNKSLPHLEIKLFCLMRTINLLPDINIIYDPCFSKINIYQNSDTIRCKRQQ